MKSSGSNCDVGNKIIYNTEVLKYNLCDYNVAYISVIKWNNVHQIFINCAPFIKCITKIDGTTLDDAENLDLVIPMYSLLKYSSNYMSL